MGFEVGIDYSVSGAPGGAILDPRDAARRAEEVGLDHFWIADNLSRENKAILECMLVLASASAVTDRIGLGVGVVQLPMRKTAWVAKEVATLQVLSGNRFSFGVGVGGTFPDEWATIGVPTKGRGRVADAMLEAFPALFAGEPATVPDADVKVTLLPVVPKPPIWVGGASDAALRRLAKYCDGWLPAKVMPDYVERMVPVVNEMAAAEGRPAPRVGVQLHGDVSAARGSDRHQELTAWAGTRFKLPPEIAPDYVLCGSPEQVAEQLARYRDAGATLAMVSAQGDNWLRQCEILGEVRQLLGS